KEERKPVNELVWPGIGIIRKDQTKRYIDNGYLDSDLHTQTGSVITDRVEQRLGQFDDAVRLRLATKEHGLKTRRQSGERIWRIQGLRRLKFGHCYEAIVTRHQTNETRRSRQRV